MVSKQIGWRLLCIVWAAGCFFGCDGNTSTADTSAYTAIEFETAIDSGNMENARYLGNHRFLVQPRSDYGRDGVFGSSQMEASWDGRTWWYHFAITIPEAYLPLPINLEIDASNVWVHRMYAADRIPVISCDGTTWRFVGSWESWNEGEVAVENPVISDTLTCPTTYVALATPYPWTRMESFLESIFSSPYVIHHDIIGHTPLGENQESLPLYYLLLSEPGTALAKRNVVIPTGSIPARRPIHGC